ncbi:WbqC family protein [Vibrio tubiashii]|uniref:WbqC family protein n=1 Tax=Vibrio tubiashii TaxID=29498 RepID=UPI001EFE34DB|nr:WbqC family protein [Vibrio tubiashii]MCG9584133.1 WbqC family protein [Vibrio tubiashii]MCG9617728.1 WbqC family protein [Vibrio tubiashii]MCG9688902.1 WbqC family protein [Vibrio tubiashii]
MTKRVAISQSNYIPWKGYFDLIASADVFVLYDDMQYTKRDWRNRNKIQTANGTQWLTIPVEVKGKYHQKINETLVAGQSWRRKHWAAICQNYSKAPFFKEYKETFETLYLEKQFEKLSDINYAFMLKICQLLGITTQLVWSTEFELQGERSERLVNICKHLKADVYVTAPAAKSYLETPIFDAEGIQVDWFDYDGYKEYPQLSENFEPGVSVLDLIFNMGPDARKYLRY